MREILFRGKRKSDGEWVYGLPCYNFYNDLCIQTLGQDKFCEPIIRQTLGQCIGLRDGNGKVIYEGDIMDLVFEKRSVVFDDEYAQFEFSRKDNVDNPDGVCICADAQDATVIGNIHDNPELLKGGGE